MHEHLHGPLAEILSRIRYALDKEVLSKEPQLHNVEIDSFGRDDAPGSNLVFSTEDGVMRNVHIYINELDKNMPIVVEVNAWRDWVSTRKFVNQVIAVLPMTSASSTLSDIVHVAVSTVLEFSENDLSSVAKAFNNPN